MRTCYCGKVNESLVDKEVTLYGWVHRCRDHGGLIFIDLRDREGMVQVVVDPSKEGLSLAEKLHNEDVISVKGMVLLRPDSMINKEIYSGKVEVQCSFLEVLNKSVAIPFQIDEYQKISEDVRLKYRYLDLRRFEMTSKMMFRAKAAREIRSYLDLNGFIEIETPILTKTTPEGARDFLVPSRKYIGSCYALPQSPQIFKQLLMMSGMDRYYQIVQHQMDHFHKIEDCQLPLLLLLEISLYQLSRGIF